MPVSLRLPPELVKRIAKLADKRDVSPHAFMLEAIKEKLDAEEARVSFHAEALRRLAVMKQTGSGIPADEVFAFLKAQVRGEKARRPKARKLP